MTFKIPATHEGPKTPFWHGFDFFWTVNSLMKCKLIGLPFLYALYEDISSRSLIACEREEGQSQLACGDCTVSFVFMCHPAPCRVCRGPVITSIFANNDGCYLGSLWTGKHINGRRWTLRHKSMQAHTLCQTHTHTHTQP